MGLRRYGTSGGASRVVTTTSSEFPGSERAEGHDAWRDEQQAGAHDHARPDTVVLGLRAHQYAAGPEQRHHPHDEHARAPPALVQAHARDRRGSYGNCPARAMRARFIDRLVHSTWSTTTDPSAVSVRKSKRVAITVHSFWILII